jgi:hypothetical protein
MSVWDLLPFPRRQIKQLVYISIQASYLGGSVSNEEVPKCQGVGDGSQPDVIHKAVGLSRNNV